jgi:dCTP deaminase
LNLTDEIRTLIHDPVELVSTCVCDGDFPRGLIGQLIMILSGSEIQAQLGTNIQIDPFNEDQLNPNSYNLRLHDELLVYEEIILDMRKPSRFRRIVIPPEGLVLQPNQLYLGRTIEHTETHNLVPMLEGRSSIGRLGLFVHVTAGFGDVGFCGFWTLEMFAVQTERIYPGDQESQIFYHTRDGDVTEYKSGKYQHNKDIQPSLLFRELGERDERQMQLDFDEALKPQNSIAAAEATE